MKIWYRHMLFVSFHAYYLVKDNYYLVFLYIVYDDMIYEPLPAL